MKEKMFYRKLPVNMVNEEINIFASDCDIKFRILSNANGLNFILKRQK